jgi:DNA-binding LacI/PurR family transcriptional regulator
MGPLYPISDGKESHDGVKGNPTVLQWGDAVWDPVVEPVLAAVQEELNRSVRGGPIFALVVRAWKSGVGVGSNTAIAGELGWVNSEVAEGFRLVRERLKNWQNPAVELRVREYTRELVVTAKGGVRASGDLLLAVGGARPDVAGMAMAGAGPVARSRGMRVICEQPADAEEQARLLDAGGYAGYLVLPVDETDDYGALGRLGSQAVLLDIGMRRGGVPCVSFDYAGAGLYCTGQLLALGCTDVVVVTREHDSRLFSIGEGYRRAMRRAEGTAHRAVTVDGSVVDTLCWLQERGLLGRGGGKLGIVCADGELGEGVLRYLDGVEAGSWNVAVAIVGGKRWAARHWVELIWVELDYAALAAEGARYLLGAQAGSAPQVQPRYEMWTPRRKPAGVAEEPDQGVWRQVKAG